MSRLSKDLKSITLQSSKILFLVSKVKSLCKFDKILFDVYKGLFCLQKFDKTSECRNKLSFQRNFSDVGCQVSHRFDKFVLDMSRSYF